MKADDRGKIRKKIIPLKIAVLLLSVAICSLLIYLGCVGIGLWYIDRCYANMPMGSINRDSVNERFPLLKETEVVPSDVPTGYRDKIMEREGFTVYRYSFMFSSFSFHVVYDSNEMLVEAIPTYE